MENRHFIWITLINNGYIEYTKNFLKSIERHNINFNLTIYCIDLESYNELKNEKNCSVINANIFLNKTLNSDLCNWNTIEYKKIVFSKLDAISYTLNLGYEIVGYIDTDIILFSDPTQIMLSEFEDNVDVVCQCDEGKKMCSYKYQCPNICSGVMLFKNNKNVLDCLKYNENNLKNNLSDQHYLNDNFKKYGIKIVTIPKEILVNGGYYGYNTLLNKVELPKECKLLHFNYLVGKDKKKAMITQNMWYLG
jgi:hypothetical protein